ALPAVGPVRFSFRSVSGTSAMLANVTVLAVRLTAPGIVMPSAGKLIAIVGALTVPPSVTVPLDSAALGTSGEVAVAVPTWQPAPEPVRHGTPAATFGGRPFGDCRTIDLLADSFAAGAISATNQAPLSCRS